MVDVNLAIMKKKVWLSRKGSSATNIMIIVGLASLIIIVDFWI